jgi:hypothetical protein
MGGATPTTSSLKSVHPRALSDAPNKGRARELASDSLAGEDEDEEEEEEDDDDDEASPNTYSGCEGETTPPRTRALRPEASKSRVSS